MSVVRYRSAIYKIKDILRPILRNEEIADVLFPLFCIFRMDELLQPFQKELSSIVNNNDTSSYSFRNRVWDCVHPLNFYNTFEGGFRRVYSSYDCNRLFWDYYSCFDRHTIELFQELRFEPLISQIISDNKLYLVLNAIHELLPNQIDSITFDKILGVVLSDNLYGTTNDELAMLMVKLACDGNALANRQHKQITMLDFSCGYGGILFSASRLLSNPRLSLFGSDSFSKCIVVSELRASLLGCHVNFETKDCLTSDVFGNAKFDMVVSDIPLNVRWIPEMVARRQDLYPMEFPTYRTDANLLYVLRAINSLNESGRAVVITKQSVLKYGANLQTESMIRKFIIENDLLESLITLPSSVTMPYSKIPICIWVLNKKKDWQRKGLVQLINGSEMDSTNGNPDFDYEEVLRIYDGFVDDKFCRIVANESFLYYSFDVLIHNDDSKSDVVRSTLPYMSEDNSISELKKYGDIDLDTIKVICDFNFDSFFGREEIIQEPTIQELSRSVASMSRTLALDFDELGNKAVSEKIEESLGFQNWNDDSWKRLPLISVFRISSGVRNTQGFDSVISVNMLRSNFENRDEKAVVKTSNGSSESDAIMIIKGANSGEVFRPLSGVLSSTLVSFSAKENYLDKKFAYYLLKAHQDVFQMLSSGMTVKSIGTYDLKGCYMRIPPLYEQIRMVEYLDPIVLKIDEITNALGVKVPVLEDYRQKLISDVVKGKIRI